jgi:hypothetical protein
VDVAIIVDIQRIISDHFDIDRRHGNSYLEEYSCVEFDFGLGY